MRHEPHTFQRQQIVSAQQAVRAVPAPHDLAQGLGQKLGRCQILLAGLPGWPNAPADASGLMGGMEAGVLGKIKRMQRMVQIPEPVLRALPRCPLCQREIPISEQDAHHFIPKSKGGRETVLLHRICHRQIHALFSETELARQFNTAQALLSHAQVQTFVKWVHQKPNDFFQRSRKRAGR
jgi:hypothetical protein